MFISLSTTWRCMPSCQFCHYICPSYDHISVNPICQCLPVILILSVTTMYATHTCQPLGPICHSHYISCYYVCHSYLSTTRPYLPFYHMSVCTPLIPVNTMPSCYSVSCHYVCQSYLTTTWPYLSFCHLLLCMPLIAVNHLALPAILSLVAMYATQTCQPLGSTFHFIG